MSSQIEPRESNSVDGDRKETEVFNYTENETGASSSSDLSMVQKLKIRFPWYKLFIHALIGCFFTGWWLSIVIQEKHRHSWLIPTVFWLMLVVRLITWHWKILPVILGFIKKYWDSSCEVIYGKLLPAKVYRLLAGATVVLAVVLLGTFVPEETEFSKRSDRAISFLGLLVAIGGLFATSRNRRIVNWNAVIGGVLMQFIVALLVLRTTAGYDFFNFISTLARELLSFAKDGVAFLTNTTVASLSMFFFLVLPSVAFFVAFVHIFYYYGVIQWFIRKFAKFFNWSLRISGAEAVTASASPFIGIGESAILIKDLLPFLTISELHQVMTSGFATISGAVLVGYIGLGLSAQALVSSCVMSIPASIAVSKLRCPETEVSMSQGTVNFKDNEDELKKPQNVLQAFAEGANLGLFTAATMLIQCMCIIALVSLINAILTWFGKFWNIEALTLNLILAYIFYPCTFLLGVPRNEIFMISKLIAAKFVQNEYVAYSLLVGGDEYTPSPQEVT